MADQIARRAAPSIEQAIERALRPGHFINYNAGGIVNLFPPMRALGREVGGLRLTLPSGGHGQDDDLVPGLEAFPPFLSVRGRGKPMPTRTEVLRDGTIGREKTLSVAR